jgi:hypothetical protein
LAKSQAAEWSADARQVARIVKLEEANTLLWAELDTARSKLAEVEHHERTLTSENEGLMRDLESARTTHDATVEEKALVQQAEWMKLQCFLDSIHKKLAELWRDTEASIATLGVRRAEFPTNASLSDFFKWFRTEITSMPTAFTECNENITCYPLIVVFQMLAGEGCEHLLELKRLALSYNASVLHDFPVENGQIAKKLVKNWWTKHGLPYCMQQIEEENRVSCGILFLRGTFMRVTA